MSGRVIGGHLYGVCENCGKIVRLDKPIFGGVHVCTLPEERKKYAREIRAQYDAAEKWLSSVKG